MKPTDPTPRPADEAPAPPAVDLPAAPGVPGTPGHRPAPIDLATESVAGEEDPGASIDLDDAPGGIPPSPPDGLPGA